MTEPAHHAAYRAAWDEYRTCFDEPRARELERAMDAAQNNFRTDEFHAFKVTLPGFVEYWRYLGSAAYLAKLLRRSHRRT